MRGSEGRVPEAGDEAEGGEEGLDQAPQNDGDGVNGEDGRRASENPTLGEDERGAAVGREDQVKAEERREEGKRRTKEKGACGEERGHGQCIAV